MGWVLRLVETGTDGAARGDDVMEIELSRDLGDIANLGLTLAEAKQLLARVQRAVVAAQAHDHAGHRPNCSSCGGACHIKDWRFHQVATLFGTVAVRLPAVSLRRLWSSRARYQLAVASSVDPGAGPVASASFCPHALPRRRWHASASLADGGRKEPRDLA
jgi:hypothetical protein